MQAIFDGPQTNFTVFPRSSNGLLAILKNTLELEQWTNRNQEFAQWTNRKQQKFSRYISHTWLFSLMFFDLKRVENGNDDISTEEQFSNFKTRKRCTYFLLELFIFVQIFEFFLENSAQTHWPHPRTHHGIYPIYQTCLHVHDGTSRQISCVFHFTLRCSSKTLQ
jgi:hypothetical protein